MAALAGALVVGGLITLTAQLTRRAQAAGQESRSSMSLRRISAATRWRLTAAFAVGMLLLMITRWPVAGLAGAAGVVFVPKVTATKAGRKRTAVLEGLEQWTRRLADMLTAGRGLEEALEVSVRTAPAAIAGPVTSLARRLSARVGAVEALRAFANEIGDPAGDRIAAALIIATGRRGGAVHGVLRALAEMLARDVAARRDIEADRAQHRTTLRWIVAFVAGFTLFAMVNSAYSAPYGSLAGEGVLGLVAGLYAAALAWLHKLGEIPAPGRFLDQRQAPAQGTGAVPRGQHRRGAPGGAW
jgi:Flp pilus assembly protein TadB